MILNYIIISLLKQMTSNILSGYGSYGFCITPPISTNKLVVVELKKYDKSDKSNDDVSKIFKYNSLFGDHEDEISCWTTYDDNRDTEKYLLHNLQLLKVLDVCLTKEELNTFISIAIKDGIVRESIIEIMYELVMYSIIKKIDPYNRFTPKIKGINIVRLDNDNKSIFSNLFNDLSYEDKGDYDIKLQNIYPQIIMENCGNNIRNIKINFKECLGKIITFIEGIKKINDIGYIHRDIKTGNVLYNTKKFTLIDYGLMIDKNNLYSAKEHDRLVYKYKYNPPEYQVIDLFNKDFASYSSLLLILLDDEDLVKEENKNNKLLYYNLYNAWIQNLTLIYDIDVDEKDNVIIDNSYLSKYLTKYFKDFILQIAKKYNSNKYTNSQSLFEDCIDKTDVYSLGIVLYNMTDSIKFEEKEKDLYIKIYCNMMAQDAYSRPSFETIIKLFTYFTELK